MKVTKEHLIGDIADFPIEVVQKMVDYQEEQGNKADPSKFATDVIADREHGNFTWSLTPEGSLWWGEIINSRNFSKFFEKYPRKQTKKESIILINKNKVLTLKFNL